MSLSNGRRSVSDEGISHWIDATDEELGEEVCIIFLFYYYLFKEILVGTMEVITHATFSFMIL